MIQIFKATPLQAISVALISIVDALHRRNHTRISFMVEEDSALVEAESLVHFNELAIMEANIKECLGPTFEVTAKPPKGVHIRFRREGKNEEATLPKDKRGGGKNSKRKKSEPPPVCRGRRAGLIPAGTRLDAILG